MMYYFWSQADIAACNISLNVWIEDKPEVFSSYQLSSCLNSEINNQRVIMVVTNKLKPDDFRDIE